MEAPIMSRTGIPYPWISTLAALLIIIWQFVLSKPEWVQPHELPEYFLNSGYLVSAFAVWLLLVTLDIYRYFRGWARYKEKMLKHEEQIAELFDSRRELGTRVRTYSDHADKLKLFISDKLLEYLEYDEKFLHFKNIASEVRHNGVISYDKAQTALKNAAALCADRLNDPAQVKQFEQAADSLLYLWDLLDIATTDNITLHVANRIYDSEEYYYQSTLNNSDPSTLPYVPTFSLFSALQKAILPIVETPAEFNPLNLLTLPFDYCDQRLQLRVENDSDMLGNINHMVLLLENLLNNAVYYAGQKSSKNLENQVTILLTKQQDEAVIEIYNRGSGINEENRKRIFQLGYSSRRIRDHHGKGLGLYFVNEICKGFEGSIDFENIENQQNELSLRIQLSNGSVETHFISIIENNAKPLCLIAQKEEPARASLEWSFSSPVSSVEISSQSGTEPQLINDLSGVESFPRPDTSNPLLPRWKLNIINRKRSAKLVFKPIDVRGVRFRLKLPTAVSRLEI
jgi:signal transduction histidine kinase